MSFNLCDLPPAEKALIEVDKGAAYAVWKKFITTMLQLFKVMTKLTANRCMLFKHKELTLDASSNLKNI